MIRSVNPREALLRPIGEWYVVFTCAVAAYLTYYAYEYLFMSKSIALVSTGVFIFIGAVYFRDGLKLREYQRNIRRLRHYELDFKDIPYTNDYVKFGKG